MNTVNWRKKGTVASDGPRRDPKKNRRFGVNQGKHSKNNLVIDEHIQEATPEHIRIEIDNIFREFLADSSQAEYIFPPEYNNLQRKYIHYKAQTMNIQSKSYGKEPNRQLHLKKKPKQVASKLFQITVNDQIAKELEVFKKSYDRLGSKPQNYRAVKRFEKVYGRLQDSDPVIPKISHVEKEIQNFRKSLPIFEKRELVLETISQNQVVIISSETGSGKTTQIPQYILEDSCYKSKACKIVCTQPRRISTLAAAERVAYERGENVGSSVGYHIRLESKCAHNTNLLYCTVGVFLRNLMCGNRCLNYITHVLVDEIHERDKLSDFLLICLRQNLALFPNLKIILMSATADTTKFQQYFKSSVILSVPGRLYPIQSCFLEEVLIMTQFFSPQMRLAMKKLERKESAANPDIATKTEISEQDQENLNCALEAYMNFSEDYDYTVYYEEATADLLQLFISDDVPVDQRHTDKGWTALMIACHLGDVEFISKLYSMGASLDVCDEFGKTAYDYAKSANRNNILQLLDYIKEQRAICEKPGSNTNDPQFLRQLYDMTTPDDFIDYELIVALIKYIHVHSDFGSILVFLPGYDEIMQCNDHILDSDLNGNAYRIFFLHSSMNMKEQCDVFKNLPNHRKIILSTNIAESSITIEDVVFVIDVGKAKEKVYDSYNKLSALQTQWISRACAKQREGRAGRVRPGCCFRLYSSQRFVHMPDDRVPEILRVSLEELCLNAKIIAPRSMSVYNFLSLAPDPPLSNSIAAAIENLQYLGAMDQEEELTRLGEYLAQLTVEPRIGKMLIYGCIFKCLEPILTLAASMAHKDPFQLPPQANLRAAASAKRRELIENVPSDHVVYLKVFQRWQEETTRDCSRQFCQEYLVSESTMFSVLDTRRQLLGQLRAIGFVNNTYSLEEFNLNSHSWGLVKAVMSAAFFPNVAYPINSGSALSTKSEKKVVIHNSSVCNTKKYNYWCFYDEMVKNRISFMVRGVTLLSSLTVAIMCGVYPTFPSPDTMNIDDWLDFSFSNTLVIDFRNAVQALIDRAMLNPWHSFDQFNKIVSETLRKVMDLEEKDLNLIQPESVGMKPKFLYKVVRGNDNANVYGKQGAKPKPFVNNTYKNEWIENHKKGRTPKRFIPPNRNQNPPNASTAVKNLNFDNYGPSTSANISPALQDIDAALENAPCAAAALLKGIEACQNNYGVNGAQNNGRYKKDKKKNKRYPQKFSTSNF